MKIIPVLICGAGPVGLSASLALSRLGIDNLIVEKHPSTAIHPKARGLNVRTMELFRNWEVESAVRSHELSARARRLLWLESVQGDLIGEVRIDEVGLTDSPTQSCLVAQDHVEQELLAAAIKYPQCTVKFSTELTSWKQDDNAVECELYNRKTQQTENVSCQYLIAADGAHSPIREALNINMTGIDSLGNYLSVYCNVDLSPWLADRPGAVITFTDPKQRGNFMMSADLKKKWIIGHSVEGSDQHFEDDYCIQLVRDVAESQDLPVEIINTSIWEMAALNADKYRAGRVFLVGDAAHRMPPTGGMGMNTGVHVVSLLIIIMVIK